MQDTNLIRNLALFGDAKSGKTSLAEGMLFAAGKTNRLGKVDDGTSVLDFEPEEVSRKATINSSFHQYTWKKHDVYLIDTPGDDNFASDAIFAANIADSAIFWIYMVLVLQHNNLLIKHDNRRIWVYCFNVVTNWFQWIDLVWNSQILRQLFLLML